MDREKQIRHILTVAMHHWEIENLWEYKIRPRHNGALETTVGDPVKAVEALITTSLIENLEDIKLDMVGTEEDPVRLIDQRIAELKGGEFETFKKEQK